MKKQIWLRQRLFLSIALVLLLQACSLNTPNNPVVIGTTPTSTASSGSSNNAPTATVIPLELPSPAPTPVQSIDICGFFTAAEAEPIVGTALIDLTPGTDIDEVTGGPMDYCTYKGDDVALVISLVKSNAAKDSPDWQAQLLNTTDIAQPNSPPAPASDIGEQAYWVVNEDAAGWYVAKYPYIFALVVGGNIGYAEDYKEDIKTLAQKVVNALP